MDGINVGMIIIIVNIMGRDLPDRVREGRGRRRGGVALNDELGRGRHGHEGQEEETPIYIYI